MKDLKLEEAVYALSIFFKHTSVARQHNNDICKENKNL